MIKDLQYVKNKQKEFLEHLKDTKGYFYQECNFNVPYWLILALQTELSEIANAKKVHKWWDDEAVDEKHVLEECSDFLAHLGNLANFLNVDMIINTEDIQVTAVEVTFNRLAYQITTLTMSKRFGRITFKTILGLFVELIYSLGFNFDDLQEAYNSKIEKNYIRFK